MSTPEEHLMNLHDLELKKKFLECIKDRFVHDINNKIDLVNKYIEDKEKVSSLPHVCIFSVESKGTFQQCTCGRKIIKLNDEYFYTKEI